MNTTKEEPKSLPRPAEPDGDYENLRAELEAVRARQRALEEKYEHRNGKNGAESHKSAPSEEQEEKKGEEPKKPPLRQRLAAIPREHPVGLVIGLILLAAVVIGGYFLLRYFDSYESTDDAQINGHLNAVGSRINGTVIGVYVEDNRSVVQGQTLVKLDPRDYEVALQQAQGNLAQALGQLGTENPNVPITQTTNLTTIATAQADVASAEAAVAAAQHDYETAVADQRQAEANNVEAQADEARYRQLVTKDEVAREQYDQKLAAARASQAMVSARRAAADAAQKTIAERQAGLEQARSRLSQAQQNNPRQLEARRAAISQSRGAVESARAQVANAALQLSYCTIAAPVAGIVGNKNVEVGQRVQAGQQLLVITQMNDLWVDANFKETQIRRMRPGQPVTIHVDALGQDFNGYLENMPGATGAEYSLLPPENATGNYVKVVQRLPVRIRFSKGQAGLERLRPGMSVEPKVWLQ